MSKKNRVAIIGSAGRNVEELNKFSKQGVAVFVDLNTTNMKHRRKFYQSNSTIENLIG